MPMKAWAEVPYLYTIPSVNRKPIIPERKDLPSVFSYSTDTIPDRVNVAIPRGGRIPALCTVVDIYVFASKTFDLGRDEIAVGDGISIGLYSAERSLVDVIRLRHREGSDVAWDALRRWLRLRGSKPASLLADLGSHNTPMGLIRITLIDSSPWRSLVADRAIRAAYAVRLTRWARIKRS